MKQVVTQGTVESRPSRPQSAGVSPDDFESRSRETHNRCGRDARLSAKAPSSFSVIASVGERKGDR